jgi:hypothetical protein
VENLLLPANNCHYLQRKEGIVAALSDCHHPNSLVSIILARKYTRTNLITLIAAFSLFSIVGYTQTELRDKYCMAYPVFRADYYIFGLLSSMLSLLQDNYNHFYKNIFYICVVLCYSHTSMFYMLIK